MITGSTRIWTNNVQSPVTIESRKYQVFFFFFKIMYRHVIFMNVFWLRQVENPKPNFSDFEKGRGSSA
jgi:hypothetical protein